VSGEAEPTNVASRLIASLEAEAQIVDHGAFTIDQAKAREKLRDYQLVNVHGWTLLVVELATLLGAKAVYFDYTTPTTTKIHFRAPPLSGEQLADPFAGVFASFEGELAAGERAARRASQKLAIAVHALVGRAQRIELESLDAHGRGTRARWSGDEQGRFALEPVERDAELAGNHLRVEFGETSHVERERELLRTACRRAHVLVMAGSEKLSFGWKSDFELPGGDDDEDAAPSVAATTPIRDADFRMIGLAAQLPTREPARLRIQTNGVLAEVLELEGLRKGFSALVDLDLARDLSQSQVLRDAGFERMLALVRATHDAMRG
jgi:hypothetical protein